MIETSKRGGARKGAGRKKSIYKRHDPPHRKRHELSNKHPVHVTLRTRAEVPRLRQRRAYKATRRVLERFLGRADFRVVHLSIQHNHFHFLIEARDKRALSRGMQSLTINLARAIAPQLQRTYAFDVSEDPEFFSLVADVRQVDDAAAALLADLELIARVFADSAARGLGLDVYYHANP